MIIPPKNVELRQLNDHFLACNQRFEDMPQQDKGRLCHACDRVLLDFTQIPVKDLIRFQADNDFKHCGNYTHQQVQAMHNYLSAEEMPKRPGMGWLVSLAIGMAGFSPLNGQAQEAPNPTHKIEGHQLQQINLVHMDTTSLVHEKGRPDNPVPCRHPKEDLTDEVVQVEMLNADTSGLEQVTIKGSLIDSVTGEPVPFANVTLVQGEKLINGVATDFNGEYEFNIELAIWKEHQENLMLVISSLGYEEKIIPIDYNLSHQEEGLVAVKGVYASNEETVPIEELNTLVIGMIVNYDPPLHKKIGYALNPANWYRRVKWKISNRRGY